MGTAVGIVAVAVGASVGGIDGRAVVRVGATDASGNAVVTIGDAGRAVATDPIDAVGIDVAIGATLGELRGTFRGAGPAVPGDVMSIVGTGKALASGIGVVEIRCAGRAEARSKPAMEHAHEDPDGRGRGELRQSGDFDWGDNCLSEGEIVAVT